MTDWTRRNLLGLKDLSKKEINTVLDKAQYYRDGLVEKKNWQDLRGKRIINLFMEPSTRTRVAFELAAKSLAADVISIAEKSSSLTKGESLKDTALNIQALGADAVIIRHSSPGSAQFLSRNIQVPVINAGDGSHEHPSQALLDMFTLRDKLGDINGKKITILGDILFSRVARSNLWGLLKLGAKVTLAGPSTLVPEDFRKFGATVSHNLREALHEADAIMLLRIQHERQSSAHFPSLLEYTKMFGLKKRNI